MEKAFRSRYVIGETGKVSQPQRFFSVPGNTTLRLGETDIGACRHNLQGDCLIPASVYWLGKGYGLVQEKTLDRPAHYL